MNDANEVSAPQSEKDTLEIRPRLKWLNWSSFFFAFVQSVCTAFIALSSLRLVVGAVAFAGALGILRFADKLHVDAIRIPMMLLALAGALANSLAWWQVRRLRGRSASAWRQQPLSASKRRSERIQLALSVLTIALLVAEELFHWKLHGRG